MAKRPNKNEKVDNPLAGTGKKRTNTHQLKNTGASRVKVTAHAHITPAKTAGSQLNRELKPKPYSNGDTPKSKEELVKLIRTIVREELDQLPAGHPSNAKTDIDRLAEDIFNKYDDVFKALA